MLHLIITIPDYQKADLVRLDILLNGETVDALVNTYLHRDNAYEFGRKMCVKLKELIPTSAI